MLHFSCLTVLITPLFNTDGKDSKQVTFVTANASMKKEKKIVYL